jgi:metal-responsive CopG/Arc/MetJ family transcriptional regulator
MQTMKKKKGRARDRGEVVVVSVEMPRALNAALERFSEIDRRSKRAILIMALEAYLQEKGVWPPEEEVGK